MLGFCWGLLLGLALAEGEELLRGGWVGECT